jgi:hypothetical protein
MKQRKDNDAKRKNDPARPTRKLELRQATLRKLTTEQLLVPAGGTSATVCPQPSLICPTVPFTAACPKGPGY